ncbi:putative disease resistance RPP13-like protein 1, partial [Mucuna pruriens]
EIESRIKQVLDNLEFLSSLKGDLGLKEVIVVGLESGSGSKVSQKLPSTSLVVESVIYGRDYDKEIIFNWLTSDADNCNQLSILSVVGMGGMGKTTLAQHVYNHPRIEEEVKFDIKAWVCVSDDFDVLRVTRAILEAITKSKDDGGDLERVHGRLKEELTGKRFLLVLDDVWNEKREKWEAVQTPLNYGAQGSRILVTTRSGKVASTIQSKKVHHLEQLQEDHCWQVFGKHAFQDDNPELNAEQKEIGMKIVKKCQGLPLALKTIGSLLHTKSSVSKWESVLTSKIWDLPQEDCEIIPALFLSYRHLPSHLKRCFAFCALFPKDYVFVKEHLIQLWTVENFLQCHQQRKCLEEVGEEYFDDLLSRSFFQQSSEDERLFVMHDLLNHLAKYICGDICYRLGVDDKAKCISERTRHFSFPMNHVQYFDGFDNLYDAKRLRTFMPLRTKMDCFFGWHCEMSIQGLFNKFKFLRVLSLSGCSGLTEVPDFVGDFKHLRSLDLSHTDIKKLPDSMCSLYNLQILKLNWCGYLEELPSNLDKLTNLSCLEFEGTKVRKMPMHLGKLKNLQVLSSFYVGKSGEFGIQQLGELNLHGSLSIKELENIENPLDALAANLKNKIHLMELKLGWNWKQNQIPNDPRKEREVLENLQPSKHLKKLSIYNYGGTQFPSMLSNVVSLTLENCKYCLCLPPLGRLPFLKKLMIAKLNGIVSIDSNFYGNSTSSFSSLERLEFDDMQEWEDWECTAVTGVFPRLQLLYIEKCPKFRGHLPGKLLHLKDLSISNCEQLVASAPMSPEICTLNLQNCGEVKFDYHPTTLNKLRVTRLSMEDSSLKMIEHMISNTSLESLDICSCPNMNILMTHSYDLLAKLKLNCSCDSLTIFPLDFFPKLRLLDLDQCRSLQMISQEQVHNHLKTLRIVECPQFESFPSQGLSAPSLTSLTIEGLENLKSFPVRMHVLLPSLDSLVIKNCPKEVESFPGEGLPSTLTIMHLSNCYKLIASMKGALGANTSLESLYIENMDVESFPDEGLLPLSLKFLRICNCPDLKILDYKGLCQLSSLEELDLTDNPSLQCLPQEGLPKSISTLRIWGNCPLLKQRCLGPKDEDWGKIVHIENIWVDHE